MGRIAEADRALTRVEFLDKGAAYVAADVGHDGGAEWLFPADEAVSGADAGVLAFPDVEDEEAAFRVDAHYFRLAGRTGGGCGGGLLPQTEHFVKLPHGGFHTKPGIGIGSHRLAEVVGHRANEAGADGFEVGRAAADHFEVGIRLDQTVVAPIEKIASERLEAQLDLILFFGRQFLGPVRLGESLSSALILASCSMSLSCRATSVPCAAQVHAPADSPKTAAARVNGRERCMETVA